MDAALIALFAKVFNWAKFRQYKGGVKIHMQLNYQGCIPQFASTKNGKVHEKNGQACSFTSG
jgi:hypothetical protein